MSVISTAVVDVHHISYADRKLSISNQTVTADQNKRKTIQLDAFLNITKSSTSRIINQKFLDHIYFIKIDRGARFHLSKN